MSERIRLLAALAAEAPPRRRRQRQALRMIWYSHEWHEERRDRIQAWCLGTIGPVVMVAVVGRLGGVW